MKHFIALLAIILTNQSLYALDIKELLCDAENSQDQQNEKIIKIRSATRSSNVLKTKNKEEKKIKRREICNLAMKKYRERQKLFVEAMMNIISPDKKVTFKDIRDTTPESCIEPMKPATTIHAYSALVNRRKTTYALGLLKTKYGNLSKILQDAIDKNCGHPKMLKNLKK